MKKLMMLGLLALWACAPANTGIRQASVPVDTSNSTAEAQLAKSALSALQAPSFAANTEFCGYIYRDVSGQMQISQAVQGEEDSCLPPELPNNAVILASFHTHGAFSLDASAEFPSPSDVLADEAEGIDGYVSTPGGRLWFVDSSELTVSQLCGIGCLPQDPNFQAGIDGPVAPFYTLSQLNAFFAG